MREYENVRGYWHRENNGSTFVGRGNREENRLVFHFGQNRSVSCVRQLVSHRGSLDGGSALRQFVFTFWTFEGYLETRLRGSYPS